MRRYLFFCLIGFVAIVAVLAFTAKGEQQDVVREYKLVFFDDFNSGQLDTTIWSKIPRNKYGWGKYMSSHPSLYQYKRDYLRLLARYNRGIVPSDTAEYLTGGISTEGKYSIRYGKVEVRARLHGAVGSWPAIWLFKKEPAKVLPDPGYAEIDILEYPNRENYVMQTVHNYYTLELKKTKEPPYTHNSDIDPDVFNIYTVEILPEAVIFSINGEETFRYPKIETNDTGQYPFGQELYLLIDMQVGAGWLPTPDRRTYPAYMDVDWVKIYELKE